jgi:hypothetical protein
MVPVGFHSRPYHSLLDYPRTFRTIISGESMDRWSPVGQSPSTVPTVHDLFVHGDRRHYYNCPVSHSCRVTRIPKGIHSPKTVNGERTFADGKQCR